jgi:hypothetical protein
MSGWLYASESAVLIIGTFHEFKGLAPERVKSFMNTRKPCMPWIKQETSQKRDARWLARCAIPSRP